VKLCASSSNFVKRFLNITERTNKMKRVLITGATDGIGKQTAFDLAENGFEVIVHGRDENKAVAVADEIKNRTGNENVSSIVADLSSLKNVRKMGEEILSRFDKLDVLINNAGVFMKRRTLTPDGFEMTFAVNHLAHFLLTNILLPLIKASEEGRIINVSSMAHQGVDINFENLNGEKGYSGYEAYSVSKLTNVMHAYYLADVLKETNVTVNALHPGVISTKLLYQGWGMSGASLKKGAETSVFLASSDDVKGVTGKYFVDCKATESSPESYNQETQNRLWEISEKLTEV